MYSPSNVKVAFVNLILHLLLYSLKDAYIKVYTYMCCVLYLLYPQLLLMKQELEGEVEALQTIPDHYYMLLQQTYRMEKLHWEEKKRNTEKELNVARTEVGMIGR